MPSDPVPLDRMPAELGFERLPKIHVLDRLAVRRTPIALLPLGEPFGNAGADVLGIGVQIDFAGTFQRSQRLDGSGQLHPIIGGEGLGTAEFLAMIVARQHGTPASRPRVTPTGAVSIDLDVGHAASRPSLKRVGSSKPLTTRARWRQEIRMAVLQYTRLRAFSR